LGCSAFSVAGPIVLIFSPGTRIRCGVWANSGAATDTAKTKRSELRSIENSRGLRNVQRHLHGKRSRTTGEVYAPRRIPQAASHTLDSRTGNASIHQRSSFQ
jgi:hypothetical protein